MRANKMRISRIIRAEMHLLIKKKKKKKKIRADRI
jgi:hypothetical protein